MLTARQAADRLGVSPRLIYRLCKEQVIPHRRDGGKGRRGRIRIEEADIEHYERLCRLDAADLTPAELLGDVQQLPSCGSYQVTSVNGQFDKHSKIQESMLHEAALKMAQRCIQVVEDALFQWELGDAEREFLDVILVGIRKLTDDIRRAIGQDRSIALGAGRAADG